MLVFGPLFRGILLRYSGVFIVSLRNKIWRASNVNGYNYHICICIGRLQNRCGDGAYYVFLLLLLPTSENTLYMHTRVLEPDCSDSNISAAIILYRLALHSTDMTFDLAVSILVFRARQYSTITFVLKNFYRVNSFFWKLLLCYKVLPS